MTAFTKKPQESADDGDLYYGTWGLTGTILELGQYHPTIGAKFGVRFPAVTIPQGATINSAKVSFFCNGAQSGTVVNVDIWGEDVDDAAVFSTEANYDGRALTTAKVDWDGIGSWSASTRYDTPSLVAIIQEIIDRPTWVSGNALAILVKNDGSTPGAWRRAGSYDHSAISTSELIIDYTSIVLHEKEITEGIAVAEVLIKNPIKIISEGVALGEVLQKVITKAPFIEGIAIGEVVTAVRIQIREIIEGIAIGESVTKMVNRVISEGIAIGEVLIKMRVIAALRSLSAARVLDALRNLVSERTRPPE